MNKLCIDRLVGRPGFTGNGELARKDYRRRRRPRNRGEEVTVVGRWLYIRCAPEDHRDKQRGDDEEPDWERFDAERRRRSWRQLEFALDDLILIEIAWGYCADKLIGLNVSKLGGVPYAM